MHSQALIKLNLSEANIAGEPDAYGLRAIQNPDGKGRAGRVVPDQSPGKTILIRFPVSNGGVYLCWGVTALPKHPKPGHRAEQAKNPAKQAG